jgi:hypothetical protein
MCLRMQKPKNRLFCTRSSTLFCLVFISILSFSFSANSTLTLKGIKKLPGIARDVEVRGPYAFVSTDSGLASVDISNPSALKLTGYIALPGYGRQLMCDRDIAYVTDGKAKAIQCADISKPDSLKVICSFGDSTGFVWAVEKNDDTIHPIACVASLSGVSIADISPILSSPPNFISRYNPYFKKSPKDSSLKVPCDTCSVDLRNIKTDDIKIAGKYAFVLYFDYNVPPFTWEGGYSLNLKKLDLVDPRRPVCIDSLSLYMFGCALDVSDGYAFVVYSGQQVYAEDADGGLGVIDLSGNRMSLIKTMPMHCYGGEDIVVKDKKAFVANGYCGVRVFNVANPAQPVQTDSFDFGVLNTPAWANGITAVDSFIYVAAGPAGLLSIKTDQPVGTQKNNRNIEEDPFFLISFANQTLTIRYFHTVASMAEIGLYDLKGRLIARSPALPARNGTFQWNFRENTGNDLQTGTYVIQCRTNKDRQFTQRLMIAR